MYKAKLAENNVYEATLERYRILFTRFDRIVISFSGGKDSTATLNCALTIAEEMNKLPLDVYFFDEEAIHPETEEYVRRIASDPRIRFKWICIPIQHRNACSRTEPFWYPWDPKKKNLWVRPMPKDAITEIKGFYHGCTMPDLAHKVYDADVGTIADCRGLRATESPRRRRAVLTKLTDNFIGEARDGFNYPCSPIYDWSTVDVWTAPKLFNWDYNHAYDLMAMAGVSPNYQRVCPPFGEEPLAALNMYAILWPDLWDKMTARVDGAATAARYARTELYSYRSQEKPEKMTWKQYCFFLLNLWPVENRKIIANSLTNIIANHQQKTKRPIHEDQTDQLTGLSWKNLAQIIDRGDLKGRKKQLLLMKANSQIKKMGITKEELFELDAGDRY